MKSKKLNLESLQVKSFVTAMNNGLAQTVKGGDKNFPTNEPCTNHNCSEGWGCPEPLP